MFNSKLMKCVALTGLLGLFAPIFSAIGEIQNYAFAQITPAPQKHDDSNDSDQSSSNGRSIIADDGEGSDSSENHRVLLMTVKVKIRMAQRARS
jgi:hypothetical protein